MNAARHTGQSGFTLIEVLITFLIIAIGLLGLAGLQVNTMNSQFEAYQRVQITYLLDDMSDRIRVNPSQVATYTQTVSEDYGLQSTASLCSTATGATRDLCEWNQLIAGVAVVDADGRKVGAPLNARGCIESVAGSGGGELVVRVTVAWQGIERSAAPSVACGKDQYGDEGFRRALFRDVIIR